jgi:predicted dehydrogenase
MATEPDHPYMKSWWPPGHALGWEHTFVHQYQELLEAIAEGRPASPSFEDGWRVQSVLDAVEQAAASRCWVRAGVNA